MGQATLPPSPPSLPPFLQGRKQEVCHSFSFPLDATAYLLSYQEVGGEKGVEKAHLCVCRGSLTQSGEEGGRGGTRTLSSSTVG